MKIPFLPLCLFVLSAAVGFIAAIPGAIALFFYTTGALLLLVGVFLLFIMTLGLWHTAHRKKSLREPEQYLRFQGYLFNLWFASHNLFWAFLASFSIWGLYRIFGPRGWVMIMGAGALACALFALLGTLIRPQQKMLGLCWSSVIPDGLNPFWDRAGAAFILHCRYQQTVKWDQKQTYPQIWALSRVYDRTATGGAQRGVELFKPQLPAQNFKIEWQHRARVLVILFAVTTGVAALTALFGFTSQPWNQVPKGWPTGQSHLVTENQEKNNHRENIFPSISHGYNDGNGKSGEENDIKIQGNESTAVEENTGPRSRTQDGQLGEHHDAGRETDTGQQTQIYQEGQIGPGSQTQSGQSGQQAPVRPGEQTQPGQQTPVRPGQQAQLPEGKQTQSGLQGQQAQLRPGQQTQSGQSGQQARLQPGQQTNPGLQGQQAQLRPGQQTQSGQQAKPGQSRQQAQLQPGQQTNPGLQGQQAQLRPGQQTQPGQQAKPGQSRQQAQLQPGQQTNPGLQGQQAQLRPGQQAQPGQSGQQGQQAQLRPGQQAQPGQSGQQGQQAQLQPGQQAQLRPGQQAQPGQSGQQGQQAQLQPGQQTQPGQSGQQGQQAQLQPGQQAQPGQSGQQAQPGQSGQQGQQAQLQPGQQAQPGQSGQQGQQAQLQPGQQTQSGQSGQPGQQAQLQPGQQAQNGTQGAQTQTRTQGEKGQVASGKGSGYGTGSPDEIPGTTSTPEPPPEPPMPSRSTPMVTIDIPPLPSANTDSKGQALEKNNPSGKPIKKIPAPVDTYKTSTQNKRASSPEQYLPNWILNLTNTPPKTPSNANPLQTNQSTQTTQNKNKAKKK